MKNIVLFAFCAAMSAIFAEENVYWSDTPVTCHWIGKVTAGYTTASEYTAGLIPMARPVASPSVGRNDPCPCGSGKKYKKCCGRSQF